MPKSSTTLTAKTTKGAPNWRVRASKLNINTTYEGRTCEIILMAELVLKFSHTIPLFQIGAKNTTTSTIKSIDCENLLINNKEEAKLKSDTKSKQGKSKEDTQYRDILKLANDEAAQILTSGNEIPLELQAQLLKLTMISMIHDDVSVRDEERKAELKALDESNEHGPSSTKKVTKAKTKENPVILPKEVRVLYFILSGFYESNLLQELAKLEIFLSGILELAAPETVMEEITRKPTPVSTKLVVAPSESSNSLCGSDEESDRVLYVNKNFGENCNQSVRSSLFSSDSSIKSYDSATAGQIEKLHKFWTNIYALLEGELQAKYLENAAHFRVHPLSATNDDLDEETRIQEVFLKISKEILKYPEVRRQHQNYLNHVKVYKAPSKSKCLKVKSLRTYRRLINAIPLDCFSISLLLHCLVEEVCIRISEPSPPPPPTPPSISESKSCISQTAIEEDLADYLIGHRKKILPKGKSQVLSYHHHPKLDLKISKKFYCIHENSWLEFRMNSYEGLPLDLLKINLHYLKNILPALLLKQTPRPKTIEVVYTKFQLQNWIRLLQTSIEEVKLILSLMQLNSLECSSSQKNSKIFNSLQLLFPKKNDSELLKITKPSVKRILTPKISTSSLHEHLSYLKVPKVEYSNDPNIYEAKNLFTYFWHENLAPINVLQLIEKANFNFICLDHKYCSYNDALVLRFHNDLDAFGVNSRSWSQSIRTPVCFRDFCKYVIHTDVEWIANQEEEYQTNSSLESIGKPPKFLAYNLGKAQIQIHGSSTTFCSMDGYKVVVDRSNFIGKPLKLSINIAVNQHDFFFHYVQQHKKQPVMFHFCLADGSVIVFSKPSSKTNITIVEKINNNSDQKRKENIGSSYQPRTKNVYLVSEVHRCHSKFITVPFSIRKDLVVPEELLLPFLEREKTLSQIKTNNGLRRSVNKNASLDSKEVVTLYTATTLQGDTDPNKLEEIVQDNSRQLVPKKKCECKTLLKKIKEAKKLQIPMFKIYSSKLLKFEYVKRCKSHIHISVKNHTIALLCKHPNYRMSRNIKITKLIPIKLTDNTYRNQAPYDVKLSLPSGLIVYTIPGINNRPLNIRQKYIEKGPQCKLIEDEYSRTFSRDGYMVIKKHDGTLEIFFANGQIIRCKIPYSKVLTQTKHTVRTKGTKFHLINSLELQRRRRHVIEGIESRFMRYQKKLRHWKLQMNNFIYLHEETPKSSNIDYTIITHDGLKLKVSGWYVKKCDTFFKSMHEDKCFTESMSIRDDGTITLLEKGGVLTTLFNNNTIISSWLSDERLITIVPDASIDLESTCSLQNEEEWVDVQIFYKFEHPNYATVVYNKDNYETEINLPNAVLINIMEKGSYFVGIDDFVTANINQEYVSIESQLCNTCRQRSKTTLNLKPIYNQIHSIPDGTELLKSFDSYEKIFIVNYDGKCFRNNNYVVHRTNKAHCPQHDQEETQQLFVLNRDLSGIKFWDVKSFSKRALQITDSSDGIIQFYKKDSTHDFSSIEFRTHEYEPYHSFFIIRDYDDNKAMLSKYRKSIPPRVAAYTTFCHLFRMPKESLISQLTTALRKMNLKNIDPPKSDDDETICKCISQITREKGNYQRQYSLGNKGKTDVSSARLFHDRWYASLEHKQSYSLENEQYACDCITWETPDKKSNHSVHENHEEQTTECFHKILPGFSCICTVSMKNNENVLTTTIINGESISGDAMKDDLAISSQETTSKVSEISTIPKLSEENKLHDVVHIQNINKSNSNAVIAPPTCPCNMESSTRDKHSETLLAPRQAGGDDTILKYRNIKSTIFSSKESILKQNKNRIMIFPSDSKSASCLPKKILQGKGEETLTQILQNIKQSVSVQDFSQQELSQAVRTKFKDRGELKVGENREKFVDKHVLEKDKINNSIKQKNGKKNKNFTFVKRKQI